MQCLDFMCYPVVIWALKDTGQLTSMEGNIYPKVRKGNEDCL